MIEKYDVALVQDKSGYVVVHRADCPDARQAAAHGDPVVTLFACEKPLPTYLKRHSCLTDK